MNRKVISVVTAFLLLTCFLCAKSCSVEIRTIGGLRVHNLDTGFNYTTIQEAIDDSNTTDGNTIFAEAGTYYEHVVVNKELTLRGESQDTTVIDGNGTGTVVELGANATLENFNIRHGEYGVRIYDYSINPVYTGNTVKNNRIDDNLYGALLLRGCANNTVINNIIFNNTLFGIHIWSSGNNAIANNTVMSNGHGIDFYANSNDNVLRNNNMTGNDYNFGLILRGDTENSLNNPYRPGIVNDVDASNTVDGKPIYYWIDRTNEEVPSDAGYVWLNNCTNITINGCSLSKNLQGILLAYTNETSITNNTVADNVYGIQVGFCSNGNTINSNELNANLNGVYLGDLSRFTTMRNTNITGGRMNFGVSPDLSRDARSFSDLINDIDISNTVDGKPIVYWINQHSLQVPQNAGYVLLLNSTGIRVEGLNLSRNVQNIFLLGSNDTLIANNSIADSVYGIDIEHYGWVDFDTSTYYRFDAFNTTITGNILADNSVGLRIQSDNSTITGNTLLRNPLGIRLAGTSNSVVSKNVVVLSDLNATYVPYDLYVFYYPEMPTERSIELNQLEIGGIFVGGQQNTVSINDVISSAIPISMVDMIGGNRGSGNRVFHNNFVNNTQRALGDSRARNYWDDEYPSGGNYWSDYTGTDLDMDGIGDSMYFISSGNQDNYPLMGMYHTYDVPPSLESGLTVDAVSNSTISDFSVWRIIAVPVINSTSAMLAALNVSTGMRFIRFNVTGQSGTGFLRVSIPKALISPPYTILTNNFLSPVYYNESSGDNGTHRWVYIAYPQPSTEVVEIWGQTDTTSPWIANVTQQPDKNSVYPDDNVEVYASISDSQSGVKRVILNVTINNETPFSIEMTNLTGETYNATIPPFPDSTNVTYVIIVEDNVGNNITTQEMGYTYQYQVMPEFASLIILPLFMFATLMAAIFYKRENIGTRVPNRLARRFADAAN
jgi:parallel beta-helix repeat protein